MTSPATLASDLDAERPAAIVTGYEPRTGDVKVDLETPFRAYAHSRGYRLQASPWGKAMLFVRPTSGL